MDLLDKLEQQLCIKNLACSYCQKAFIKSSKLNRHINETHLNLKQYECKACGKNFKRVQHLKRHELMHSGEKPWVCIHPNCPMSFSCKHHLTRHDTIVHQQSRNYICEKCGIAIHKKKGMNKHKLTCSKEDVYQEEEQSLKRIPKLQTKIKKKNRKKSKKTSLYLCNVNECLKSFTTKSNLRSHISTTHEKAKQFTCKTCGMEFGHKCSAQRHMFQQHPDNQKQVDSNQVIFQ